MKKKVMGLMLLLVTVLSLVPLALAEPVECYRDSYIVVEYEKMKRNKTWLRITIYDESGVVVFYIWEGILPKLGSAMTMLYTDPNILSIGAYRRKGVTYLQISCDFLIPWHRITTTIPKK